MMHKPVLEKQRAVQYSLQGEMEIINNLDKVYNEVELWAAITHPNITKMFEPSSPGVQSFLYTMSHHKNYC